MKRKLIVIALILVSVAGAGAFYRSRSTDTPRFQTVAVTRGSIVDAVEATGTLESVDPVQIGSQVSGTVVSLGTDFNQLVKKGQVVATLDPALFQAQVEQAQATVMRLEADLERAKVQVTDANQKLLRAGALAKEQLIPDQDLDAAQIVKEANEAALKSAEAQLVQARASLEQSRVNLGHTIIRAPDEGVVLSRSVEIGQTVSASLQAPTLFIIARDLAAMRVNASVDESDIGRVQAGQDVRFTVDAYGQETFTGQVTEVRLQPLVTSGVVSYPTMIDVPNPSLKLKPGMTATVSIEMARQDDVLRIPAAALRFRPTPEQRGLKPGEETQLARPATGDLARRDGAGGAAGAGRRRGPRGANGAGEAAGSTVAANASVAHGTNGTNGTNGGTNGSHGTNGTNGTDGTRSTNGSDGANGAADAEGGEGRRGGEAGVVWTLVNDTLTPVRVRVGLANATHVALLDGPLQEGADVITGMAQATATAAPAANSSPLMPQMPRRGRGGRGGGRGGG